MIINFIHIPKNGGTSIKEMCVNKSIVYNGFIQQLKNNEKVTIQ